MKKKPKKRTKMTRFARIMNAAQCVDWQQLVANGGPPCFHVVTLDNGKHAFCMRAKKWGGHRNDDSPTDHDYVSLENLLMQTRFDALQDAYVHMTPAQTHEATTCSLALTLR